MIVVALFAVVLNGVISFWLRSGAKHDLNIRSAYLHMLGDAISALGVVAAGVFVAVTGNPIADPVISVVIGAFIIWSSWGIITEALNVLMEATPKGLDMAALEESIKCIPGVLGVHDLHAWSVASNMLSFSCHIVVADQAVKSGEQILEDRSPRWSGTIMGSATQRFRSSARGAQRTNCIAPCARWEDHTRDITIINGLRHA